MDDISLSRNLHRLRRTVLMLQTELRQDHLDEPLIADIEVQMENGIATDPRCSGLMERVDALRESVLTPRTELYRDAARACEQLKDAIEAALEGM